MSKIAEFFKKALKENQAGYIEMERVKKREQRRQKIESEIAEREKAKEKYRKQFEVEFQAKYVEHRIALQNYSHALSGREFELSQREDELNTKEQEIASREQTLSEKEQEFGAKKDEFEKTVKAQIKKYSDKKKKELNAEAERAKEKARADLDALQEYKAALHRTELTIIDWLKRVDRKEREAFEEIRKDVEEYKACNQSPPEDGFDFERKFAAALQRGGFENVTVTEESGDFGADILAEKDGVKYVIQCKYYTSSVGVKAVQQVFASKIHYSAHVAVVATNSVFTKSAQVLAEETGVLLWNGLKVQDLLTVVAL